MKCRFCKAKITASDKKCPQCKKMDPQPEKKPVSVSKRRIIIFACVGVLTVLGIVLMIAMLAGWDIGSLFRPRENNIYFRKNYTVSDRKAQRKRDQVVATLGDAELTNGMLQIYYWRQVYDFRDNYGSSAAYMGLDLSGDLAKQAYLDGSSTWQQYFLESALQMWQTNQAFAHLAQQNNYQLPENYQQLLDNIDQRLQETAIESGYSSVDEMVRQELGPGCTAEDYAEYFQVYYLGYLYFREMFEAIQPSQEEIEAYFAEHEEELIAAGVSKDGSKYVNIRHIMLYPEGGTMYPDGTPYYTDEAWDVCLAEAELLLTQWKNGERTEASFAKLAQIYSNDQTTYQNGGLYTDVAQGDMWESIDTWCFDANRKEGDTTIVKTDYGYHILYFIEAEDVWYAQSRSALQEELGRTMVDEVLAQYTFQVDYKKIVLGEVEISG